MSQHVQTQKPTTQTTQATATPARRTRSRRLSRRPAPHVQQACQTIPVVREPTGLNHHGKAALKPAAPLANTWVSYADPRGRAVIGKSGKQTPIAASAVYLPVTNAVTGCLEFVDPARLTALENVRNDLRDMFRTGGVHYSGKLFRPVGLRVKTKAVWVEVEDPVTRKRELLPEPDLQISPLKRGAQLREGDQLYQVTRQRTIADKTVLTLKDLDTGKLKSVSASDAQASLDSEKSVVHGQRQPNASDVAALAGGRAQSFYANARASLGAEGSLSKMLAPAFHDWCVRGRLLETSAGVASLDALTRSDLTGDPAGAARLSAVLIHRWSTSPGVRAGIVAIANWRAGLKNPSPMSAVYLGQVDSHSQMLMKTEKTPTTIAGIAAPHAPNPTFLDAATVRTALRAGAAADGFITANVVTKRFNARVFMHGADMYLMANTQAGLKNTDAAKLERNVGVIGRNMEKPGRALTPTNR